MTSEGQEFEVSSAGRVRLGTIRVRVTTGILRLGLLCVFTRTKKYFSVHRLVTTAFGGRRRPRIIP